MAGVTAVTLTALWLACYDRNAAVYYCARRCDWQIAFAEGKVSFLYKPRNVPRPDGAVGLRPLGSIYIRINRSMPRTFGFDVLGIGVAGHGTGQRDHDVRTPEYTYVGVPYWLLLALLGCYVSSVARRARVSENRRGFEVSAQEDLRSRERGGSEGGHPE